MGGKGEMEGESDRERKKGGTREGRQASNIYCNGLVTNKVYTCSLSLSLSHFSHLSCSLLHILFFPRVIVLVHEHKIYIKIVLTDNII